MSEMINKKVLIFSLVIGIITFLVSIFYLSSVSQSTQQKSELVRVVVAKETIAARTVITGESIKYSKIPRQYVLAGAILDSNQVINRVAEATILANEQLTNTRIARRDQNFGLSFIIPKNKRAVSVEVDAAAGIAGLIKPADLVDIVVTIATGKTERTITILQQVPVIAINKEMQPKDNEGGNVNRSVIATFALSVADSEKLILASSRGTLKLLLRPVDDEGLVNSWGTTEYNLFPRASGEGKVYVSRKTVQLIRGTKPKSEIF